MDWLKSRTGKSKNSLSEFSEKSKESKVQAQMEGLAVHKGSGNASFSEAGGIEVIDVVQTVRCVAQTLKEFWSNGVCFLQE